MWKAFVTLFVNLVQMLSVEIMTSKQEKHSNLDWYVQLFEKRQTSIGPRAANSTFPITNVVEHVVMELSKLVAVVIS